MKKRPLLGPILYGALFVVLVPVVLVLWAGATAEVVGLTTVHAPWIGWSVALLGVVLIVASMTALWVWGRGLPMNAYPPPVYVQRGPYRFTGHPIYVGFGMVCIGAAVAVGSSSGLWLVSPMVLLGMAALVMGYENRDLEKRFGDAVSAPLLSLTPDDGSRPTAWHRASIFVLVFLPWTLAYEAVYRLGIPPDAVEAYLPFERQLPVLVWTEFVYTSVYFFVGLVPFFVPRSDVLRRFAVHGLFATVLVTLVYLVVPMVAPPRPFMGGGRARRHAGVRAHHVAHRRCVPVVSRDLDAARRRCVECEQEPACRPGLVLGYCPHGELYHHRNACAS